VSPDAPVERAKELARESNFLSLCRIGFLGRGVLYILIAFLALRTGRTEDLTGALTYLNEGIGRVLLIVIAAGLSAYGLWRLADAAFGIEHPVGDAKAMRKRAAAGGIGIIYLYLAYKSVRILLAGEAGEMSAAEQADTVLDLPGGAVVLGLAALGLAAGGLNQIRKAWKCTFLRNLDHRGRAPFVLWLGRIGYTARGVIFLTVAYLIGHAAVDGKTDEVGGMEKALDFFSGPVLYAVALGLLLFGVFSLIEAVFRQMHEPPSADAIKRDVQAKVGS